MYEDVKAQLDPLSQRVDDLEGQLEIAPKRARVSDLDNQAAMPAFWDDNEMAQKVLKEKGILERTVRDYDELVELRDDVATLLELAEEMQDADTAKEAADKLEVLDQRVRELEIRRLLSGEQDAMDAIVEVHAGEGGTDAADWAQLLMRMYMRWAEQRGFEVELLDEAPAEEAGIRSGSFAIRGPYAFGYLQAENGVHRLVRISPFDQNARRQTAFAAVSAIPEVDDSIEVELNMADVRIDTMRASGAGGQHINTTDSAVRMTHEPTGIVVLCRAERSQHKNRDKALKMLKAKLYQRELELRMAAVDELNAKKMKIGFGSQIRSYVMQPYQQVKDLRTGETTGDVSKMLDGSSLQGFMESWLAARAEGRLDEA